MHSYGATLLNNKTESEAVRYLLAAEPSLRVPSKEERKKILMVLNLPKTFARAFDLVQLPGDATDIFAVSPDKWRLIELKTTKKKLLANPIGFFFGATDNEFRLAKLLGDRYAFCFVSLHAESPNRAFLTSSELESRIKTRRIQYQINL